MSLFKRGNTWWIDLTTPGGQRIRCSSGTSDRKQAQECHDQIKVETWRVHRLGEKPDRSWQEAAVQWLKETEHKASHEKDKEILRWLHPYLGALKLSAINRELISRIGEAKALESSKATANRYLALVRAILRRARDEWEWVDWIPKVRLYPQSQRRVRWITREQAETLIAFLPPHQAAMARFALATGLRQRNVCLMEWCQVDMERKTAWVHADQAKARKPIAVPLNAEAMAVLNDQLGQDPKYVFTYQGKPVWQVNTKSWRRAVQRAGLEDFRWHDLRHTWASWHVQAGTPTSVLQEMGAWSTSEMVRRYAHLSAAHLAIHAERIVHGTITTQGERS